jgi:predicted AAA+ superfamily ATPase
MKRIIDHYLLQWVHDPYRKPLLLRGARQVGKTYAVRQLGKSFDSFVEINLERSEKVRLIFSQDLDPHRIIRDLSFVTEQSIIPGKTLLFIDEIQARPEAVTALDLLETAGIAHKVLSRGGRSKVLFIDIGLAQASLNLNLADWFLQPQEAFVNKGTLVEAFVGQETLVYADAHRKQQLYYWQREAKSSNAEIDYLIQKAQRIIPIEVKSGAGTGLKSMCIFLETHGATPYGIRFATLPHSVHEKLYSYPLYAVAQVCAGGNTQVQDALASLLGR